MSINDEFNLKLEQYILGELSQEEMKKIESVPKNLEYINKLKSDNSDFFNKFDVDSLVSQTQQKVNESKIIKFPTKVITAITAVAACFILTLNIIPGLLNKNEEIIYLKGRNKIHIYKKIGDEVQKLNNLDLVKENDQLQISYSTKEGYGIIFSVDGLNNITFHYPENLKSSKSLDIGSEIILPSSYTLDNAPYFEKFYLVTSKDSFDFEFVKRSILNISSENGIINKDLVLPENYTIKSLMLLKE